MRNHRNKRFAALPWMLAAAVMIAATPAAMYGQSNLGIRERPGQGGGSGSASANEEPVRPPTPTTPKEPSRLLPYGVLFLVGGITIGVGLIPSKRTHQD